MTTGTRIVIVSTRMGFRQCGRAWSGSTLCEVAKFVEGGSVNWPAMYRERPKALADTGHYPLSIESADESTEELGRSMAKAELMDKAIETRQAELARLEEAGREAADAAQVTVLKAEKAAAELATVEKQLAGARKQLADADKKLRNGGKAKK